MIQAAERLVPMHAVLVLPSLQSGHLYMYYSYTPCTVDLTYASVWVIKSAGYIYHIQDDIKHG